MVVAALRRLRCPHCSRQEYVHITKLHSTMYGQPNMVPPTNEASARKPRSPRTSAQAAARFFGSSMSSGSNNAMGSGGGGGGSSTRSRSPSSRRQEEARQLRRGGSVSKSSPVSAPTVGPAEEGREPGRSWLRARMRAGSVKKRASADDSTGDPVSVGLRAQVAPRWGPWT